MSIDPETTRVVRSWLEEGVTRLPDPVLDAVLDQLPATPQRRAGWPAWRSPIMNKVAGFGLAAAAVVALLVAAAIGSQLFSSPTNVGGGGEESPEPPPASPSSVAVNLASGSFTVPLGEFGEAVDIEAVRSGEEVSGTMEISDPTGGEGAYSVDVQCARTTDEGFLLIGGEVTQSSYEEFIEDGAYVVIAIASGTPMRMVWAADVLATDEVPAPAASCAAYLDTLLSDGEFPGAVDVHGRPIAGDLQLGE